MRSPCPCPVRRPDGGHAIVLVGYELNPTAPGGGAFIFRNLGEGLGMPARQARRRLRYPLVRLREGQRVGGVLLSFFFFFFFFFLKKKKKKKNFGRSTTRTRFAGVEGRLWDAERPGTAPCGRRRVRCGPRRA